MRSIAPCPTRFDHQHTILISSGAQVAPVIMAACCCRMWTRRTKSTSWAGESTVSTVPDTCFTYNIQTEHARTLQSAQQQLIGAGATSKLHLQHVADVGEEQHVLIEGALIVFSCMKYHYLMQGSPTLTRAFARNGASRHHDKESADAMHKVYHLVKSNDSHHEVIKNSSIFLETETLHAGLVKNGTRNLPDAFAHHERHTHLVYPRLV